MLPLCGYSGGFKEHDMGYKSPHAELIEQYAEDCKTHEYPWLMWQVKWHDDRVEGWRDCSGPPFWSSEAAYRRRPKTLTLAIPLYKSAVYTPGDKHILLEFHGADDADKALTALMDSHAQRT